MSIVVGSSGLSLDVMSPGKVVQWLFVRLEGGGIYPWNTCARHGWDPIHFLVGLGGSAFAFAVLMTLFLYRLHKLIQLPELLIYLRSSVHPDPALPPQNATNRSSCQSCPCQSFHPSMNRLRSFERTFAIPSGSRSAEKMKLVSLVSEWEGESEVGQTICMGFSTLR